MGILQHLKFLVVLHRVIVRCLILVELVQVPIDVIIDSVGIRGDFENFGCFDLEVAVFDTFSHGAVSFGLLEAVEVATHVLRVSVLLGYHSTHVAGGVA